MKLLAALALIISCGSPKAPPLAPTPAPAASVALPAADSPEASAAFAKADEALTQLGGNLRSKLMAALQAGGPAAAVEVCSQVAPGMANEVREQTGVAVGRASLRQRSPAIAAPDWVAAWLALQGEREAEGVQPLHRVDMGEGGPVARVITPITVAAPCLACHGPAEGIDPSVRAVLAERYPDDAATGYQEGDLRGAMWAEVALAETP